MCDHYVSHVCFTGSHEQAGGPSALILQLEGEGEPAPPETQISPPLGMIADAETTSEIHVVARRASAWISAGDVPRLRVSSDVPIAIGFLI